MIINSKAQHNIHKSVCCQIDPISEWFKSKTSLLEYPIYSSYDIRDSGYKVTNVDANIYPAGFNNICPTDKESAAELFKKYIQVHYGLNIKKIMLITEEHTNNPFYLENVASITEMLTNGGFKVQVAFPQNLAEPLSLTSVTGKTVTVYSGYVQSQSFKDFAPDIVMSNNDFSLALSDWGQQLALPLNPPRELGWYQRKKSRYFENYNKLVDEFSKVAKIDPFLMRVETELFSNFDINSDESRDQLATAVDMFLARLQKTYLEKGIEQKPFCFVKNNAGTYGLAVVKVNSGDEVKEWTYKSRKKMKAAKGGREVEEVIIQEGIPSVVTAEGASAEPVIYMVGCELAGGFLRTHSEKSSTESLNSPGAVYKKLCVTDLQDDREKCPKENVYGWSAKLGLLAIGLEAQQMNVQFKGYQKAACGTI